MPLSHTRLIAYLADQPAAVRSVTLSFAEAGELLGSPLPVAARGLPWWKYHPRPAHRPGWGIGRPHITPDGWVVTFRRVPPDRTASPCTPGRP